MKIALIYDVIYPYIKGGAEKRIYEISKILSEKHEVHIFGMKFWKGKRIIKKDNVYYHGVCKNLKLYNKLGNRNIFQPLYFSFYLLKSLLKEDFDIVDCYNFPYFPCFATKAYSTLRKKPFVITWIDTLDNSWYSLLGIKGIFGKRIEKLVLRLTKHNVSISKNTSKKLLAQGLKGAITIPAGIDLEKIKNTKPSKEKLDVLFAGRLVKEKNIDILIRSVKLIDKKCGIIGDGPEIIKLRNLAKELKANVKFFGFLEKDEEVYGYMKSARVFVLPSVREGFGITILEALACNCLVITTNHEDNAAKDLVDKKFLCRLDEYEIAKRIEEVLKGKNNLRINLKEYEIKNIVSKLERFYENVVKT